MRWNFSQQVPQKSNQDTPGRKETQVEALKIWELTNLNVLETGGCHRVSPFVFCRHSHASSWLAIWSIISDFFFSFSFLLIYLFMSYLCLNAQMRRCCCLPIDSRTHLCRLNNHNFVHFSSTTFHRPHSSSRSSPLNAGRLPTSCKLSRQQAANARSGSLNCEHASGGIGRDP